MQTKDQKTLFLDMQEHPEKYTDEQLENMMNQIDQMADAEHAWQKFETHLQQTLPQPLPVREGRSNTIRKIAAILIPAVLLCGLAWAISKQVTHTKETPTANVSIPFPHGEGLGGGSPVRFDDVRLDSILSVVSAYYGKTAFFRNDAAKAMKFIMTWVPDSSLASFIDDLNMFDGLQLTLLRDTIFVETTEVREEAE